MRSPWLQAFLALALMAALVVVLLSAGWVLLDHVCGDDRGFSCGG